MPLTFTVFPAANREPNVPYYSATVQIPADSQDREVIFTLTTLDLVAEPDTTTFNWQIERSPDNSIWHHMAGGQMTGFNGVTPPKPPGHISCTIDGIRGQWIRGFAYVTNAENRRQRWGVDGETIL